MFVDKAYIRVKAGKGGDGAVSFHREKYVAAGGPDGGDGGRGGDVVFVADTNKTTLMEFKYKTKYFAPEGDPGRSRQCTGRDGTPDCYSVYSGNHYSHIFFVRMENNQRHSLYFTYRLCLF